MRARKTGSGTAKTSPSIGSTGSMWAAATVAGVSLSLVVGALVGTAATATSAGLPPASAGAGLASRSSVVPPCAWPVVTNAGKANVAYPDTSATYWTTPYLVEPGMQLLVNGRYANSRFMSFNAYDSNFGAFSVNGVDGALVDYQIAPNYGSVNPWQPRTARSGRAANGSNKFTVNLQESVPSTVPNTIPIAPTGTAAGAAGFLLMRVYLPKNGNWSAVKLPSITVVTSSGSQTIQPCGTKKQKPPGKPNANVQAEAQAALQSAAAGLSGGTSSQDGSGPCTGSACPPDLQFARASAATTNSVFPNSASAYVSAIFQPNIKNVVLVRALAPRTPALVPPGTQPLPWPSPRFQLQYYSMCNNIYRQPWPVIINPIQGGGQDVGCRADNETTLDKKGRYTYVVAHQSQQQIVSRWKGATFIPTSNKNPRLREVLILRNMLSAADFTESALNAPQNMSPEDAAAAMGPYYPVAITCPVKFYVTHGPNGCFGRS